MHYYHVSFRVNGRKYEGMKESEEELSNFYWQTLGKARDHFRTRHIEELNVLEYDLASHDVQQLLQERETMRKRQEKDHFTPFSQWAGALNARREPSRDDPPAKKQPPMPIFKRLPEDTPERRQILDQICVLCRAALKPGSRVVVGQQLHPEDGGSEVMGWIDFIFYNATYVREVCEPGIPLDQLTETNVQTIAARVIRQAKERRPEWFDDAQATH